MLRHFMTEAYIADALEGFDNNKAPSVLPDGDVSDDATPGIAFAAPTRFIYEALIRPFPDDPTNLVEMLKWGDGTLKANPSGNRFERTAGSFKDDGFEAGQRITVSGFNDSRNNGVFRVISVTDTQMQVSGPLFTDTADGNEKIVVKPPKTA